jgi:hypothetical protein
LINGLSQTTVLHNRGEIFFGGKSAIKSVM